MYRCSIELSARCDGPSESEREHASSIDKHARLRVFDYLANSSETLFQMIIGLMTVIIPGKYFSSSTPWAAISRFRAPDDDVPQNAQPNFASLAPFLLCLLEDDLDKVMECVYRINLEKVYHQRHKNLVLVAAIVGTPGKLLGCRDLRPASQKILTLLFYDQTLIIFPVQD